MTPLEGSNFADIQQILVAFVQPLDSLGGGTGIEYTPRGMLQAVKQS